LLLDSTENDKRTSPRPKKRGLERKEGRMPRPKAPYFPLYAKELLTDPKTAFLAHDELGVLIRLWSWMWINDVKRGCLLKESKVPISDEKICKILRLDDVKLVDEEHILKRGKYKELYSKRMRNHKTKYELYFKQTETKRKRNGNEKDSKMTIREVKRSKEKLSKDIKPPLSPFVELFNSTCSNLPKISSISKSRSQKIVVRLKEQPDLSWWRVVFEKANKAIIEGKAGRKDWRPSFDWLIENDRNALKVIEGNYGECGQTWRDRQDD